MKIGKPKHFRSTKRPISACGIVNPEFSTYAGWETDCIRCRRTQEWARYQARARRFSTIGGAV